MPLVDSCRNCCAFDVAVPDDLDNGYFVYATQGYSFIITTCPVGVICPNGLLPWMGTVDQRIIPPVRVPPTPRMLFLQGCKSLLSVSVPSGSTSVQIASLAAGLQQQWAAQQAECNMVQQNQLPTYHSTLEVYNTAQTASCVAPQFGTPVTIPARSVGTMIFNPTTLSAQQAQASMDRLAMIQAQAQLFCFNPGPDWRQLVWDQYAFNQCAPDVVVTGSAVGYQTSGQITKGAGSPCIGYITAHASMHYTGGATLCTAKLVVNSASGGSTLVGLRVLHNGVQLVITSVPPIPSPVVAGTYIQTFTVPNSVNALIEVDGGTHYAVCGGPTAADIDFTQIFFQ